MRSRSVDVAAIQRGDRSDAKPALGPVETEMLRDLRGRLNRVQPGSKAQEVLGSAFFRACSRADLTAVVADGRCPSAAEALQSARAADLAGLGRLVAALASAKRERPEGWRALLAVGIPQAVLTRRLVLAGREQVELT